MHQVIVESLEEYLTGALPPAAQRAFDAHLESCAACRQEVAGMVEVSSLFESLRPREPVEPPAGFYAQVMQQVGRTQVPSFWSLFSLDAAFGRRVVFASLLTMAVLGSVLVSRESAYAPAPSSPDSVLSARSADRDNILVTLASYEP